MPRTKYHSDMAVFSAPILRIVIFLHLQIVRIRDPMFSSIQKLFFVFESDRGRESSPYPGDTTGQLTAKPFAVRCPANACSCKRGSRLPGLSHKKKRTGTFSSDPFPLHFIFYIDPINFFSFSWLSSDRICSFRHPSYSTLFRSTPAAINSFV